MPKVLVTGANGFIGSVLVKHLCAHGYSVRALLRPHANLESLSGLAYEPARGDLDDLAALHGAVKGVDFVVHAAALIASSRAEELTAVNVRGTLNLYSACLETNPSPQRFIFISSQAAGGPKPGFAPRTEEDPDAPVTDYGRSKLEAESALKNKNGKVPYTILRPTMVYGPREKKLKPLKKLIQLGFVPAMGSAYKQGRFTFLHVEDLVQAIVGSLALPPGASGEKYFLGEREPYSLFDYTKRIAEGLGRSPIYVPVPDFLLRAAEKALPQNFANFQNLHFHNWVCSSAKAGADLGFSPQRSLGSALPEIARLP